MRIRIRNTAQNNKKVMVPEYIFCPIWFRIHNSDTVLRVYCITSVLYLAGLHTSHRVYHPNVLNISYKNIYSILVSYYIPLVSPYLAVVLYGSDDHLSGVYGGEALLPHKHDVAPGGEGHQAPVLPAQNQLVHSGISLTV